MPDDQSLIFVSYSREDSAFALQLTRDLKSSGASVWLDQLDIPTGVRWDTAIEEALARCTSFLVVLSPASVASENVRDEIDFAIGQKKKLLPVLHRECVVPLRISRFQRVDFSRQYQPGLQALLQTLDIVTPPEKPEAPIAAPAEAKKRDAPIASPVWLLARQFWQIANPQKLPPLLQILILATVWQILFGSFFTRYDHSKITLALSSFGLPLVLALRFVRPQLRWRLLLPLAFMWLAKAIAEHWLSSSLNPISALYFLLAFIVAATITGSTVASALKQGKLKGAGVGLLSFGAPQIVLQAIPLLNRDFSPFIYSLFGIILEFAVGGLFVSLIRNWRG